VVITLDSAVSAGGLNFSSGQRQLLSMARALLRGNNVVIMDEAVSRIVLSLASRRVWFLLISSFSSPLFLPRSLSTC